MSKKSAHNASEAGQNRLIEASVEIVETARCIRSLVFVVPPDITDGQVSQVAHHVLIEQGQGLELTKEAAEGIVLCGPGRDCDASACRAGHLSLPRSAAGRPVWLDILQAGRQLGGGSFRFVGGGRRHRPEPE